MAEGFVSACLYKDYGSSEKRRGGRAGTWLKILSRNETNAFQVATKLAILGLVDAALAVRTVRADHAKARPFLTHHLPMVSLASGR